MELRLRASLYRDVAERVWPTEWALPPGVVDSCWMRHMVLIAPRHWQPVCSPRALGRNQHTALDLLTWWTGGPLSLGKTSVRLATTAPHHATALSGAEPGFRSTWKVTMGSRLCLGMRRRPVTISLWTPRRVLCLGHKNCVFITRNEAGGRSFKAAIHVLTNCFDDRCVILVVWWLGN